MSNFHSSNNVDTETFRSDTPHTACYCLLVPHYNHAEQFLAFLPTLMSARLHIVVVDDGSKPEQVTHLRQALADVPSVSFFAHARNRGKGAAVLAGCTHARALGFTHAVQIDADGQHDVNDIPIFVEKSQKHPNAIICGKPYFDESAPKSRVYGRRITDFWVALETLSLKIKDGLCGFRVYPLDKIETVLDHYFIGSRMDFDTELLVKSVWLNTELIFLKTYVIYPEKNVSHFNYLHDNLELIRLHTRLMVGMFLRFPMLIKHRLLGK